MTESPRFQDSAPRRRRLHLPGPHGGGRARAPGHPHRAGRSLYPGTVVRSRPATTLRPAPAALPRPVPAAPLDHPIGGGHFHEASARVHAIHPSPWEPAGCQPRAGNPRGFPPVFSPPAAPGWNETGFGFYHGLRTPQLPATHAGAETGPRALARVL